MDTRNPRTAKLAAGGVALGGLLFLVGGHLHPRPPDGMDEIDAGIAAMAAEGAWYPAHVITGIAFLVIGLSLAVLIRHAWPRDSRLSALGWVAVGGTALGALDSIPHTLAKTEAAELLAGAGTPLTDAHVITQSLATPLFGIGVGILAVVGARERLLGHWSLAVLGVLGSAAWALAGPGIGLGVAEAAPLFTGGFGIAAFLVVSGLMGAVRSRHLTSEPAASPALAA